MIEGFGCLDAKGAPSGDATFFRAEGAWPDGLHFGKFSIPPGRKTETVGDAYRVVAFWSGVSDQPSFCTKAKNDHYRLEWAETLSFSCLWFDSAWLEARIGTARPPTVDFEKSLAVLFAMQSLEKSFHAPHPPTLWVESVCTAIFHFLFDCHSKNSPAKLTGRLGGGQLRRVTEQVWANPGSPFSTASLASVAGVSTAHFSRSFSASLGMTPWQYVLTVRLECARSKLHNSRSPISDIAAELGFSDQAHLSRLYKRKFGITPWESRKRFGKFPDFQRSLRSGGKRSRTVQ